MVEKNQEQLKKAIRSLPDLDPEDGLWERIAADLAFEEKLAEKMPNLPTFDPAPDLWLRIAEGMEPEKKPERWSVWFRYAGGIAASLLLVVLVAYYASVTQMDASPAGYFSYSEEVLYQEVLEETPLVAEEEAQAFITAHCTRLPEVCQKEEVEELKDQLAQLEKEEKELRESLQLFAEDPDLIRRQIKIENLKAAITKELIQILLS
ncbi:hypothetical protein BH24BAC1_BH24BAC1_36440 [soil metagenome]